MRKRLKLKEKNSPTKHVRVAIYTRKSTEDGLDQEFNTLDAQRQAIESYVESQRGEGWVALPNRYDDGGFSGANKNRPAYKRLEDDIRLGLVDVVAVYKIDRLSRSLVDFSSIINFFEKHNVAFISITQQFNTASSMGKLTLNILMSFAEFERQVIAERTADKMGAARRKGMWTGGRPMLGYDVIDKKLIINKTEAAQVRQIYKLYLENQSLTSTIAELNRRGLKNKTYKTKTGKTIPGGSFTKSSINRVLTNPIYIGKVRFNGDIYDAPHKPILDEKLWSAVQETMNTNRSNGGSTSRNKWEALLRGIVRCGVCGATMTHHTTKKSKKIYHYFVCGNNLRKGASACPKSRISAKDLEGFVLDRVRKIGSDPELLTQTINAIQAELKEKKPELKAELKRLEKEAKDLNQQRKNIVDSIAIGNGTAALNEKLGELDQELLKTSKLTQETNKKLTEIDSHKIDEDDLSTALASFSPIWDVLFPRERERIIRLLISEIRFNAPTSEIEICFHPGGIRELAAETEGAA